MIKADHKKWAQFVFETYLKGLLKKSFYDFRIINALPELDKSKSLIITPNHFSWWDGFFIYWLNKKILNKKIYVMMLEEQLKRYWFFQKLGCYSIDLNDNKKMVSSLKYTLDLIQNTDNGITIYPQGEIQPYEQRPVQLKNGIDFIAKRSKSVFQILPTAFKIHYTNERLPIIYTRFGNILNSNDVAANSQLYKDGFTNNLDLINSEYSTSNFKSIL
jgi:1-acyl-sn-glycerol-3-phosphate acyltransferase